MGGGDSGDKLHLTHPVPALLKILETVKHTGRKYLSPPQCGGGGEQTTLSHILYIPTGPALLKVHLTGDERGETNYKGQDEYCKRDKGHRTATGDEKIVIRTREKEERQ